MFDIVDDNMSVDNTCFNCHSHNGQGKSNGPLKDWYGQKPMSDKLEAIYDVFVGDSGTLPACHPEGQKPASSYLWQERLDLR